MNGGSDSNSTERAAMSEMPNIAGPSLWWRQAGAIGGMELRRILGTRRILPALALALLPPAAIATTGLFADNQPTLATAKGSFATIYSRLLLGACLFFGCALVFTQLFRGEILRRSLHFHFLSPVRREVLAAAKYGAGVLATWMLFGTATVLSFLMIYLPLGSAWLLDDFAAGPAFGQLLGYLGTTMLACVGYGAVFLLFGVLFRNPILPTAALLGWETLHFLLPATLQATSVRFHLKGLAPVPAVEPTPVFSVLATSPAAWVSVLTLAAIALTALVAAATRLRRLDVA